VRDAVVAEFDSPEPAVEAAKKVTELGYSQLDAFTPFPIPELDEALGLARPKVPALALLAGAGGTAVALLVQWWCNAYDYALDVGGRPFASWPTYVVIMFETTVLFAALATFAAVLLGSRLPRLHDEVFDWPGFERTTVDRFWIAIGNIDRSDDGLADRELDELRGELERCGAVAVHDFRSRA
jgi:hypothetical protein